MVRSQLCFNSSNTMWLTAACSTGTVDMLLSWICPDKVAKEVWCYFKCYNQNQRQFGKLVLSQLMKIFLHPLFLLLCHVAKQTQWYAKKNTPADNSGSATNRPENLSAFNQKLISSSGNMHVCKILANMFCILVTLSYYMHAYITSTKSHWFQVISPLFSAFYFQVCYCQTGRQVFFFFLISLCLMQSPQFSNNISRPALILLS